MSKRVVVAHVSDLHFGNHSEDALEALAADLRSSPKPHFIAVTGDLAQWARKSLLEEAKNFLDGVLADLKEGGQDARCILVPGNHDVGFGKNLNAWNGVFDNWGNRSWGSGSDDGLCKPAKLASYYGRTVPRETETARKERSRRACRYCEYYPEAEIAFLKFDSNTLASWGVNYANGAVGKVQRSRMEEILSDYAEAFPAFHDARKIALVHHHVHYLPNTGSDVLKLMSDAGDFWHAMLDMGVQIILHGHKHYQTHAIFRYFSSTEDGGQTHERELLVLSAGTAASKDVRSERARSYYKLRCRGLRYRVDYRILEEKQFRNRPPRISFRDISSLHLPHAEESVHLGALDAMIDPEDDDIDRNNLINSLVYRAFITKKREYRASIAFKGVNMSQSPSKIFSVPLVFVGARGNPPSCSAFDCRSGQKLSEPLLKYHKEDVDKFWVEITTAQVLPGGDFHIQLDVASTGALMYQRDDFDAVGITRFSRGVKSLDYELSSECDLDGARCYSIHRSGLKELVLAKDARDDSVGQWVVKPAIESVSDIGFGILLHYRELRDSTVE